MNKLNLAIVFILISFLSGCGTPADEPAPTPETVLDNKVTNEDAVITFNPLTNDKDSHTLSIVKANLDIPSLATISYNNTTITVTPKADFNGLITGTYIVTNDREESVPTVFKILVVPIDDFSILQTTSLSIGENTTTKAITITATDIDSPAPKAFLANNVPGSNGYGTISINSQQVLTYTLDTANSAVDVLSDGENLSETFIITLSDDTIHTFTVSILGFTDPPSTTPDFVSSIEDQQITFNPLSNDSNPELLTIKSVTLTNASFALVSNTDTQITIIPIADFNGIITGSYIANDGVKDSTSTAFTLEIAPVDDASVLQTTSLSIGEEEETKSQTIFANDIDSPAPTASVVDDVTGSNSYGTISINNQQLLTYTLDTANNAVNALSDGESLSETFIITLSDDTTHTFTVSILGFTDPPSTTPDFVSSIEDQQITFNPLSNDPNPELLTLVSATLSASSSSGTTIYHTNTDISITSIANFNGIITGTYIANDGTKNSASTSFTIDVSPVDDASELLTTGLSISENDPSQALGLIAIDIDSPAPTASVVNDVTGSNSYGTISINNQQLLTYTLDTANNAVNALSDGESLSETFIITLSDDTTHTFTVNIQGFTDPPSTTPDFVSSIEDQQIIFNPLSNDSNPELLTLVSAHITEVTVGQNSAIPEEIRIKNTATEVTITPSSDFNGIITGSYIANDGVKDSASTTFTLEIAPVDDASVLQTTSLSIGENEQTKTQVLTATDIDSTAATAMAVNNVAGSNGYGMISINEQRLLTYTLDTTNVAIDALSDGESLSETFNITLSDGTTHTFTVNIYGVTEVSVPELVISTPETKTFSEITVANYTDDMTIELTGASISSYELQGPFEVSAVTTGSRTVIFRLLPLLQFDFETTPAVSIILHTTTPSTAGAPLIRDFDITINVQDVDQEPPKFSIISFDEAENNTGSHNVPLTDDNGDTNFTMVIKPGLDSDSFTSILTYLNLKTAANYEVKSKYQVEVEVSDAGGLTNSAVITFNIIDLQEPAIISVSNVSPTVTNTAPTVSFTATHTDVDQANNNNVFQVINNQTTTHGIFSVSEIGEVDYELTNATSLTLLAALSPGETGDNDAFSIASEDGTLFPVTIELIPVDDAHVLVSDDNVVVDLNTNSTFIIDVLANDYDVDDDISWKTTGTLSAVSSNANIVITAGNQLEYTPNTGLSLPLTDVFTYTYDRAGFSVSAQVTVRIEDNTVNLDNAFWYTKDAEYGVGDNLSSNSYISPPTRIIGSRNVYQSINLLPALYDNTDPLNPVLIGHLTWSSPSVNLSFLDKDSFIPAHPPANSEDLVTTITASFDDGLGNITEKDFSITLAKKDPIPGGKLLVIRMQFPNLLFNEPEGSTLQMVKDMIYAPGDSVSDYLAEATMGSTMLLPATEGMDLSIPGSSGSFEDLDPTDGIITFTSADDATPTYDSLGRTTPGCEIYCNWISSLDDILDFSVYDTNNDDIIQSTELNVLIVMATCARYIGGTDCGCPETNATTDICESGGVTMPMGLWPHAGFYYGNDADGAIIMDGVRVFSSTETKVSYTTDHVLESGVYRLLNRYNVTAHELGHAIYNTGDLYSNVNNAFHIQSWGLMGSSHLLDPANFNKSTPQHFTAANKTKLGFMDPIISTPYSRALPTGSNGLSLTHFQGSQPHPILATDKSTKDEIFSNQYFLLEVKDATKGYDTTLQSIPGYNSSNPSGVSVSHIQQTVDLGGGYAYRYGNSASTNVAFRDLEVFIKNTASLGAPTSWTNGIYQPGSTLTSATTPNSNFHSADADYDTLSNVDINSIDKAGEVYNIKIFNQ